MVFLFLILHAKLFGCLSNCSLKLLGPTTTKTPRTHAPPPTKPPHPRRASVAEDGRRLQFAPEHVRGAATPGDGRRRDVGRTKNAPRKADEGRNKHGCCRGKNLLFYGAFSHDPFSHSMSVYEGVHHEYKGGDSGIQHSTGLGIFLVDFC